MPIDINIMCIKQKTENINYNKEVFFLEKLNTSSTQDIIYRDNWFLYNAIMGIGYNLYTKEEQDSTFNLVDYKPCEKLALYMKNMVQDDRIPSNSDLDSTCDSVILKEEYINHFSNLLKEIIKASQIKTCIVLFRIQSSNPERYVGRISLKQFMLMLKKEEIYLNTGYIISEAEYD